MNILYVTTVSNTVNAFLIPHIKMLIDEGHQVDVAFNIEQDVKAEIVEMGCKVYQIPFRRSPLKKDNLISYNMLKKIIEEKKYEIIHTHTPVASAIVRLVCKKQNKTRVIYTAHGFHFYKGAPFVNWLMYYPVEKCLSRYTDVLITINREDYEIALQKFGANRVEYVPGVGIDIERFSGIEINRDLKRKGLDLPEDAFVILSVGELNKNKNHKAIIEAIAKLKNNNIKYIICGQGPLVNELKKLAQDLKIEQQVKFLGFREDIPELMKMSDLFAFPSFREGLSLSLMEAMASGLPVVCSSIRGNIDLIQDKKNGFLVVPNNIKEFSNTISALYESTKLRAYFGELNSEKVEEYSYDIVLIKMLSIYQEV